MRDVKIPQNHCAQLHRTNQMLAPCSLKDLKCGTSPWHSISLSLGMV